MTSTEKLKTHFWTSLADSPIVFLELEADPHKPVPMMAQLDKHADSAIWFFTSKDNALAQGGQAEATFASKDHEMFARFSGHLTRETSRERLEKQWSRPMEAWFSGGKDDPDLVMLRMDLGTAEIWNSDLGFMDTARMLLGFDMREEAKEEHAHAAL